MAPKIPFRRRTHAPPYTSPPSCAKASRFETTLCEECHSGDNDDELLLCDKCDRGFHTFCLRPILACVPKGLWFCPLCSADRKPKRELFFLSFLLFYYLRHYISSRSVDLTVSIAEFPLVQTKIVDFFRLQRSSGPEDFGSRKRKKRSGGLVMSKKKRKLLPFNPSEDPDRRLEQMASLATALTATGAVFSNELTYRLGMAPRSANFACSEKGGMQVLSKEDTETLNLCKKMMEKGEWPPLMVVYDPLEGFTVEADRFIRDLTIVTEYVGDVDYLKNREHDDGDSMMTLLSAEDPSKSLVICPDQRSNIARFINGINNHTRDGKKKQNLKCVRFSVNGESRVLLIANRDITKGERLYYDYNGSEQEYPTGHFESRSPEHSVEQAVMATTNRVPPAVEKLSGVAEILPPAADGQRPLLTPFLTKTYQLVDDPSVDDMISWGEDGSTFVVWRPAEFARDLLPKYFKHNNFSSFGFRKIVADRWEFANDCFRRGEKRLLCDIHRRKIVPSAPAVAAPIQVDVSLNLPGTPENSGDEQVILSNSSPGPSPTTPTGSSGPSGSVELMEENDRLRKENARLSRKLAKMKRLCNHITALVSKHAGDGVGWEAASLPSTVLELMPTARAEGEENDELEDDTSTEDDAAMKATSAVPWLGLSPRLFGGTIGRKRDLEDKREPPTAEPKEESSQEHHQQSWVVYCPRPIRRVSNGSGDAGGRDGWSHR
ncbi:hypothetical protein ZIOFF_002090 [Zingiber officinale]|uniref:[histone H3]-lysine(27) N-methyltransferase n=1 Tax=Zingiber officinale TaxID=94328 RepID=A0A8J5HZF5_ZINOF|nr:hypothetical protein ZIOFF_002090 [Zingiber officinale]